MSMTCHKCTDTDCEHAGTDHPQCDEFTTMPLEPDVIIETINDPLLALRERVEILETALATLDEMQIRLSRMEREYNDMVAYFVRRADGRA